MQGLGLLLGHLVGDYIVQNDWMAKWKSAKPVKDGVIVPVDVLLFSWGLLNEHNWYRLRPGLACSVHCLLYTLSVWAFSFWWMPWWGLVACFIVHWPIDRFRLARLWMENVSWQREFANGVFSPWSIVLVDNVFHLLTLWTIAAVAAL